MRNYSILASAVALSCLAAAARAETVFPPHGAAGDAGDELRCPPGKYATGFYGRFGSWIDQIGLVCSAVDQKGLALGGMPRTDARGGMGGNPSNRGCYRGMTISSLEVALSPDNRQVKYIYFKCQNPLSKLNYRYMTWGGGVVMNDVTKEDEVVDRGLQGKDASQNCGGDRLIGLKVRYGRHVNALGAICAPLVAAPAPPPRVTESTARSPTPPPVPQQAPAPRTFAGTWSTVTSSNGRFDITFIDHGGGFVTGTFTNTVGAPQYNGTLSGRLIPGTQRLDYTYSQPGISAGGSGTFEVSGDGRSINGNAFHMGKEAFTWTGKRK